MAHKNQWRSMAVKVITEAIDSSIASGLNREAMIRVINDSYPFGQRKQHPYKVWLDVREELLAKFDSGIEQMSLLEIANE